MGSGVFDEEWPLANGEVDASQATTKLQPKQNFHSGMIGGVISSARRLLHHRQVAIV